MSADADRLRIVVPRYGESAGGGSEALARRLAHGLREHGWDVEVWATNAGDEATWTPAGPAGDADDGGVRVRRFPVRWRRHPATFHQLSRGFFRLPAGMRPELAWLLAQGPWSPELVQALSAAEPRPTLFTPYLYHPTLFGLPAAPHPRLLIPAAHDEAPLRLRAVGRMVAAADALWYGTDEERELLESVHPVAAERPHAVGTAAVEAPAQLDPAGFRDRHALGRYLLYGGRATPGKGVEGLLEGFARLRARADGVQLVLTGEAGDGSLRGDGVVPLGRLDEAELWSAIAGAAAVVVPSFMESLSLLALQAWAAGRPCLLNGASPVLAGQAGRSRGALLYGSADEFADAAARLLDQPEAADRMGEMGRAFVAAGYRWDEVIRRLRGLIEAAGGAPGAAAPGAGRREQPG